MLRKKLAVSFLSLALIFGSFPTSAFAEVADESASAAADENALVEEMQTEEQEIEETAAAEQESEPSTEEELNLETEAELQSEAEEQAEAEGESEAEGEAEVDDKTEAKDEADSNDGKAEGDNSEPKELTAAQNVSLNAESVTLYGLKTRPENLIGEWPADKPSSFQLKATGCTNPKYTVTEGDSVVVSKSGLLEPNYITWYFAYRDGHLTSSTTKPDDMTGVTVLRKLQAGTSVVKMTSSQGSASVEVTVVDYSDEYFNKVLDDYVAQSVTPGMTDYEKVEVACKFVVQFPYKAYTSSASGMFYYDGGDCWASTDMIIEICSRMGLKAWYRNGNNDGGAGSGHVNAIVEGSDGEYYIAEAGFGSTKTPRSYEITRRSSLWTYWHQGDSNELVLVQYDGEDWPKHMVVPQTIEGANVTKLWDGCLLGGGFESLELPKTITEISPFAFASCTKLKSFEVPSWITSIGDCAFASCHSLQLTVSPDNPYYCAENNVLYDKNKTVLCGAHNVSSLEIPNTVTKIGKGALYYNYSITELTVPASVDTIEDYALANNSLETIRFQSSVAPTVGTNALRTGNDDMTICVPLNATGYDVAPWTSYNIVHPTMKDANITLSKNRFEYNGRRQTPTVGVTFDGTRLIEGKDFEAKFEGDTTNAGTVKVTITGIGEYAAAGSTTTSYTISPKKVTCQAALSRTSLVYNGKMQRPGLTVTVNGSKVDGSRYDVAWPSGSTNVGTYRVKVTLKGNYSGTKTVSYKITQKKITPTVTLSNTILIYNGRTQRPTVTVKNGNATLPTSQYTVTWPSGCTNVGTYKVKVTLRGNYSGTKTVSFCISASSIQYRTHVQTYGDQAWRYNGDVSGTFGQSKRLEGIWVKVLGKPVTGSIQYRTHVQTYGWQSWRNEGQMSGTSGESKRLEAIQIRLTGNMAKFYDVYYRVHAQQIGWMGWAKNGAQAGTAGYSYRLEGIQILLRPKGSSAPSANYGGYKQATSQPFRKR